MVSDSGDGSDWSIIAALIGCLALAWLALGDAHYREKKATAANEHSQRVEQIETARAGIPFEAERFASNPEPKTTEEREKRDLAAQEASAAWAFWVAFFAAIQIIATVIGLYYIKRTLGATLEAVEDTGKATLAMQDANRIAQEGTDLARTTMIAQQRPWLTIDVEHTGSFRLTAEGEFHGPLQIAIQNKGATAAIEVVTNHRLTNIAGKGHEAGLNDLIVDSTTSAKSGESRGQTVRPEKVLHQVFTIMEAPEFTVLPRSGDSRAFLPTILICATYRSLFSDQIYITASAFVLTNWDGSTFTGQDVIIPAMLFEMTEGGRIT